MTDLSAMRALLAAATCDLPLAVRTDGAADCECHSTLVDGDGCVLAYDLNKPDAALIVAAVNALPALLDELEALRELEAAAIARADARQREIDTHDTGGAEGIDAYEALLRANEKYDKVIAAAAARARRGSVSTIAAPLSRGGMGGTGRCGLCGLDADDHEDGCP